MMGWIHQTTRVASGRPGDKLKGSAPPPPPPWRAWLVPLGLALTALLVFQPPVPGRAPTAFAYTDFLERVNAGQVRAVEIDERGNITGQLQDGNRFGTKVPGALAASSCSSGWNQKRPHRRRLPPAVMG